MVFISTKCDPDRNKCDKISARGRSPKIDRTDLDRGRSKSTRPRSTFRPNSTVVFFREIGHKNAENYDVRYLDSLEVVTYYLIEII